MVHYLCHLYIETTTVPMSSVYGSYSLYITCRYMVTTKTFVTYIWYSLYVTCLYVVTTTNPMSPIYGNSYSPYVTYI